MKIMLLLVPLAAVVFYGCAVGKPAAQSGKGDIMPCPNSPNCVSSLEKESSRFVPPLTFTTDPKAAMDRLAAVISSMPGAKIEEREDGFIRATFTSRVFGFVDELTAQMDAPKKRIEVRSAARSGFYDFGVNRSRLNKISAAFAAGKAP